MKPTAVGPRVPLALTPLIAALVALAAVLAWTADGYGYHRDELYFRMLPLRWGYVDQPPLTPGLVRLARAVLGDHLWAIRTPAIGLACGSVLVVVLIVREVGGGRFAQGLAAWGYAFATFTLTFGHVLLTASLDLLLWPAVVLAVIRVVLRGRPHWWLVAGVLVGVGTYDKWLIVMLVLGVLVGLLVLGPRSVLRTRYLGLAALLAVIIASPNIVYQLRHGLPQLAMGAALSRDNGSTVRITMWPLLLAMIGPPICWIWILGLIDLLRRPDWRALRFLVGTFAVVLLLTFVGGSQIYYPYPVLAVIFAVGCAAVERRWPGPGRARRVIVAVTGLSVVTNVVINLPVIGVRSVGRTPIPLINTSVADQIGWPRYVEQIDAVAVQARRTDPGVIILTSNYGEAGALDRYARTGIGVFSGQNALWYLGAPAASTRTVVVVGGQYDDLGGLFRSCQVRDRLDNGVGVDNEEQGEPVGVCTGPTMPWPQLWRELRHLS